MKAKEEEGDFKHSHDIKPYNSADYSAMENDWPNPDDPVYPPYPPWNPPKPNPQDPVVPGDEDVIDLNCRTQLCWCPDKWVDANVVCKGQVVKAVVSAYDRDRAEVRWSGGNVGIKAKREEGFSGPPIGIVVTVRVPQADSTGKVTAINNIEQSLSIKNCPECCQCDSSAIGYTTLSMGSGETQNLGVTGSDEAGCEYTWELTGGDGTITPSEDGLECLYEAPATNVSCNKTATITLYCDEVQADEITILIDKQAAGDANVWTELVQAVCQFIGVDYWVPNVSVKYWKVNCVGSKWCCWALNSFDAGTYHYVSEAECNTALAQDALDILNRDFGALFPTYCPGYSYCGVRPSLLDPPSGLTWGNNDKRTNEMKDYGCCDWSIA
jgi:hypothetical protein